ncbi:hypothetical protein QUF58_04595 [Anaerolineales bacterium HSG24]|nr:hypothetical protein [Anaerolineales bacterium HSG24]
MKVITISEQPEIFSEIFKLAQTTDLILQLADGTKFFLSYVTNEQTFFIGNETDFEQEIIATRRNKALMQFLDERGTKNKRGTPIEEVREQLGL